jgi:hypothetical protein
LRSKADKVEKAIKRFTEWIKIHRENLNLNISKKVLKMAAASDQAETPSWLMDRIKKFTKLTD